MLHLGTPVWQIALRAIVVYAAVFAGFRVAGKRELGQMTVFDLVLILLIANAVQNAMVGPDTSLDGGLLAAAVLLAGNWVVDRIRVASPLADRLFEGHPTVLVSKGELQGGALRKQGLDQADLETAMREHGVDSLSKVDLAILETDGTISIVPSSSTVYRSHRRRPRTTRKR